MKKIVYLLFLLLFITGCGSQDSNENYFITKDIDSITDDGYVIVKEHDWEPISSTQTLCTGIHGVSSIRTHNPSGEVIVSYKDGADKTFLFDDEAIGIEYITKSTDSNSECVVRSKCCIYVYDADVADFTIIADDFLFYLESYQNNYYYVNTAHELVDSDGNIYCTDVVGVRSDSDPNNTIIYVSHE